MRHQAGAAILRDMGEQAVKLADGADAGSHAFQHQPDLGVAQRLMPLGGRQGLHTDHADQQGQAVGDAVIGFGHQILGGLIVVGNTVGRKDSIHGAPSFHFRSCPFDARILPLLSGGVKIIMYCNQWLSEYLTGFLIMAFLAVGIKGSHIRYYEYKTPCTSLTHYANYSHRTRNWVTAMNDLTRGERLQIML